MFILLMFYEINFIPNDYREFYKILIDYKILYYFFVDTIGFILICMSKTINFTYSDRVRVSDFRKMMIRHLV